MLFYCGEGRKLYELGSVSLVNCEHGESVGLYCYSVISVSSVQLDEWIGYNLLLIFFSDKKYQFIFLSFLFIYLRESTVNIQEISRDFFSYWKHSLYVKVFILDHIMFTWREMLFGHRESLTLTKVEQYCHLQVPLHLDSNIFFVNVVITFFNQITL